eukprot:1475134-Prymnesium_polylepis.2
MVVSPGFNRATRSAKCCGSCSGGAAPSKISRPCVASAKASVASSSSVGGAARSTPRTTAPNVKALPGGRSGSNVKALSGGRSGSMARRAKATSAAAASDIICVGSSEVVTWTRVAPHDDFGRKLTSRSSHCLRAPRASRPTRQPWALRRPPPPTATPRAARRSGDRRAARPRR